MNAVSNRKELFWGLLKARQGQSVPIKDFVEINKVFLPPKVSEGACRQTLNQMQHDPNPLAAGLTVGQDYALLAVPNTVLDEREKIRPVAKSHIGYAVWKILFGVPEDSDKLELTINRHGFTTSLSNRILDLKRHTLVTVLIDAGSTTGAAARRFNRLGRVPLPITLGVDEQRTTRHLLRLNFISNSIPFLSELSRGPHRNDIGLMAVGGDIRGERSSVCGLAAQVFLDECSTGGDVAIVGTTGYQRSGDGPGYFFSDNLEESRIKVSFFARAALRVLAFDSSKLVPKSATRVFAELAPENVDLVITDDGQDIDDTGMVHSQLVSRFLDHAAQMEVPVAVVSSKRPMEQES